jgi:hypothetical protein
MERAGPNGQGTHSAVRPYRGYKISGVDPMTMTQGAQGSGTVGSPISNEAYNVLTALQSKLEGMEAYRKYSQSGANGQIWQQLAQSDNQAVEMLVQELERMVRDGKFRMRSPGQTG